MKRFFGVLSLLTVAASSVWSIQTYVADEAIVKFRPNSYVQLVAGAAAVNGTIVRINNKINYALIRLNVPSTRDTAISRLRQMSFVIRAAKNGKVFADEVPNDPMIAQQWQINRINCPQAWDFTHGSSSVVIAICDTGVQLDHPDLQAKILPDGYDFVNNDPDASDDNGHGTHVAGLAAAVTNNATGVAGTGYDCKILPVKVLSGGGSGSWQGVADGITWAADHGANVINLSLGGSGNDPVVTDAVNYAISQNVIVLAAAGNNGDTLKHYPAAIPGVMAVASSDPDDSRSGFSTYGTWVHVTAPGNNVLATLLGSGYGNNSGTSMSCPVTAGVAGLVWARGGPSMTNLDVFDALTDSCDPVPGNYVIFGRINALGAIQSATITAQTQLTMLTADMFVGTSVTGSSADLEFVDGSYLQLITAPQGRAGSQGGIEMTAQLDRPLNELFDFNFKFRTKSSIASTGMLWLWNYQFNRWDFKRSFPTRTTEGDSVVTVTNMNRYVDASGLVSIRLRGHIPVNRPGGTSQWTYSVDFAQLEASYETAPP
jgi:thermitase